MSGLDELREALPTWVRIERRAGEPEVSVSESSGMVVAEVKAYPEAPANAVRADVHFVVIAPTEGFPDPDILVQTVRNAAGPGEFGEVSLEALAGGPSYITLGGWLGSQDLALMLIGAVELAGIADAVTPGLLGLTGDRADQMAGMGFVMLGPSPRWAEGT